jgi:hypothetical protein
LVANEIGGQLLYSIVLAIRPSIFDPHVLALNIAGFFEALAERAQQARVYVRRITVDEPDRWHHRLLRTRNQRPRGRHATDKGDEIAPPHVTPKAKAKGYYPLILAQGRGRRGSGSDSLGSRPMSGAGRYC